ncbi:hypothetical protein BDY17DRAFT_324560 [Neohortaea acidophila]|uniref:AB hydrolase-1 domain-containing protein n=1 Tax=Neohortaea acidophila TaxID=245834 RepID=A0A6A6PQP8_9PEZI|nr:uncharacterized protein BDY17DRAFT_324560 [Neohortaea acidophila]KAF2482265.1 hypothetical protein BDY17DRAFT_324560 [Neohortaea acidophila]
MPSTGPPEPLPGITEDVAVVQQAIQAYIDLGLNVVVVMHSLGGIIGTAACEGLRAEDQAEGKGITALVYLAAFVAPKGKSAFVMNGGHAPWYDVTGEPGTGVWMLLGQNEWDPREVFYNDCTPQQKEEGWALCKRHYNENVFQTPLPYAAWQEIESNYLLCELDGAIPEAGQDAMSTQEGGKWKRVERLRTDHSPFMSRPKETVEFVRRCAGEEV